MWCNNFVEGDLSHFLLMCTDSFHNDLFCYKYTCSLQSLHTLKIVEFCSNENLWISELNHFWLLHRKAMLGEKLTYGFYEMSLLGIKPQTLESQWLSLMPLPTRPPTPSYWDVKHLDLKRVIFLQKSVQDFINETKERFETRAVLREQNLSATGTYTSFIAVVWYHNTGPWFHSMCKIQDICYKYVPRMTLRKKLVGMNSIFLLHVSVCRGW